MATKRTTMIIPSSWIEILGELDYIAFPAVVMAVMDYLFNEKAIPEYLGGVERIAVFALIATAERVEEE